MTEQAKTAHLHENGSAQELATSSKDAPIENHKEPEAPNSVEESKNAVATEHPVHEAVDGATSQLPSNAVTTNGATTRQRSGKVTPARPQAPKLAPKTISKTKKSGKKVKGPPVKKHQMTLYGYWRSSCTWRVRLALALKGLNLGKEVEYIPVHLVKEGGEQKQEAFKKINPAQMVPSVIIKDKNITKKPITLSESMAICEYLEEAYPSKRKLLPKDPLKRFQVRRLCEIINSGTQPVQNLAVLQEVGKRFGDDHKNPWAQWAITRGLTSFEQVVEQTKGKYCLGNILTLADTFLPAQVYNAERFAIDMSQFPNIMSIMENLKNIPEFVAAHPSKQPDAQE